MTLIKGPLQGERVNSGHRTEGGQPKEKQLKCGHKQKYRVLPRNGDFVYCQACKDYVEAGPKP